MAERSRIKFNPETKELEIEGSESFVTATLDKIQAMLSGAPVNKVAVKKERPSKKAPKVPKTGMIRGPLSKLVLTLIQSSTEGISTAELKEKTGLKERQIWPIISRAKKIGKIKQVKRGVYGAV
ncbi:MAG: hypothetical protein ACOYOS_17635 [Syntrophales bacterium]